MGINNFLFFYIQLKNYKVKSRMLTRETDSNNIEIMEIGTIRSRFSVPTDPIEMKKHQSVIIIHKDYEQGLYRIEENKYLQILFNLHLSRGYELIDSTYDGMKKGIFASRSSRRPSALGLTKVKLLKRDGRILKVIGLDALDGSPVFDIKPYSDIMD